MIDSLKTGFFMKNGIYAVKSLCDIALRFGSATCPLQKIQ